MNNTWGATEYCNECETERLADIDSHNTKFLKEIVSEFFHEVVERRHTIVDFREYDCWDQVSHNQLMKEFDAYLEWGLDTLEYLADDEIEYEEYGK